MAQRFLPYGRHCIDDADVEAVARVLRGDALTQGPTVAAFEAAISGSTSAPHAVAIANGTAALHVAALALELKPGDAAIVPAITFAATANAVLYTGATPVFADVDRSGGIEPASLQKALAAARAKGLKPRAIFPVHYAGRPCDMESIWQIAEREGLAVVEDACHAVGAQYQAQRGQGLVPVGGSPRSAFVCWSYHPVKHVTTGEGGALTTHDRALGLKAAALRAHGITKDPSLFEHKDRALDPVTGAVNPWYMEQQDLGLNYRLCDIQAALGVSQFQKVERFVARRRAIARYYDKHLAGLEHLAVAPGDSDFGRHSYHLYPVRIKFDRLGTTRAQFMDQLKRRGVGSQVHYIPVFWHPYYQHHQDRWLAVATPEAEAFYAEELSMPMYPELTDQDLELVVASLRELAGRR
ncbi:MAG: UDP-4-amino-4,6-dideoxy-N-acetyl-beta-L-altrosamine transaminase [Hyphomicrobium sp.]